MLSQCSHAAPPCLLDAPLKAALFPFPSRKGNSRSVYLKYIYIYYIHPELRIEREQSRFRGSSEGVRGSSEEARGCSKGVKGGVVREPRFRETIYIYICIGVCGRVSCREITYDSVVSNRNVRRKDRI